MIDLPELRFQAFRDVLEYGSMLVNESLKISKINTANKSVESCRVP